MNKLLAIVGPTATGKTGLAVELSKEFPSILISVDSRQVYRGMDIVTGKDHPQHVSIAGIDIVNPDEDCSVSVWHQAVSPALARAHQNNLLPIVVGGTGLYVSALTEGIETIAIPPDQKLRQKLIKLNTSELQAKLKQIDPHKLKSMNHSDAHNPRRLIRAIELANSPSAKEKRLISPDTLYIGLRYPDTSQYHDLVGSRVRSRLDHGALEETKQLIEQYDTSLPSFTSLGYKHLIRYLHQEISRDELVSSWTQDELAYARRQLTWFKRIASIHWFNPHNPLLSTKVASLVKGWYHQTK